MHLGLHFVVFAREEKHRPQALGLRPLLIGDFYPLSEHACVASLETWLPLPSLTGASTAAVGEALQSAVGRGPGSKARAESSRASAQRRCRFRGWPARAAPAGAERDTSATHKRARGSF